MLAFQGGTIEDVHISLGGVHLLAMLCSLEEVGRGIEVNVLELASVVPYDTCRTLLEVRELI